MPKSIPGNQLAIIERNLAIFYMKDLRAILGVLSLSPTGNKSVLIRRLLEHLESVFFEQGATAYSKCIELILNSFVHSYKRKSDLYFPKAHELSTCYVPPFENYESIEYLQHKDTFPLIQGKKIIGNCIAPFLFDISIANTIPVDAFIQVELAYPNPEMIDAFNIPESNNYTEYEVFLVCSALSNRQEVRFPDGVSASVPIANRRHPLNLYVSAQYPKHYDITTRPPYPFYLGERKIDLRLYHGVPEPFLFQIVLTRDKSLEEVLEDLVKFPMISKRHTLNGLAAKRSQIGEDDLLTTKYSLSLLCPLSLGRIKLPVKGIACTHLQCVDASALFKMHQGRLGNRYCTNTSIECSVCRGTIRFPLEIRLDEYFLELLQQVPQGVDLVSIDDDGNWSFIEKNGDFSDCNAVGQREVIDLTDCNDDDPVPDHWLKMKIKTEEELTETLVSLFGEPVVELLPSSQPSLSTRSGTTIRNNLVMDPAGPIVVDTTSDDEVYEASSHVDYEDEENSSEMEYNSSDISGEDQDAYYELADFIPFEEYDTFFSQYSPHLYNNKLQGINHHHNAAASTRAPQHVTRKDPNQQMPFNVMHPMLRIAPVIHQSPQVTARGKGTFTSPIELD